MIPAYKQKLKQEVPVTRSIRKWSDDMDATLQDCFASTDWNMFRDSSNGIEEYTTIVPVPKEAKVTCLNDYLPVALTSVAMQCFGLLWLVMAHINGILPDTLDPLKFAYRPMATDVSATGR